MKLYNETTKLKSFGTPQVALDLFSHFVGESSAFTLESEQLAADRLTNLLKSFGENVFAIKVDLFGGVISWHHGMSNVLGSDSIIGYEQFEGCIDSEYLSAYNFWSLCLFEAISSVIGDLPNLMYHIQVPLINQSTKKSAWYHQHSISLLTDDRQQIVSFLSIYTFICDFQEFSTIQMMPFVTEQNQLSDWDKLLKNRAGERILKDFFTERERQLLGFHFEGVKPPSIAKTDHTINEHHSNIVKKAKNFFNYPFKSAKQVAMFMKKHGLAHN